MKKYLAFLLLMVAPIARGANTVFISQSGAGVQDGLACSTAKPVTYFNNAANWSATPTGIQIGPDTTVHACGTFTGTAGGSMFIFQASGTSGHPIIFQADATAHATLSAPYWGPLSGAINTNGKSFITLDGNGTGSAANSTIAVGAGSFGVVGTIQNTANGEGMTNRAITTFIYAVGGNSVIIKNWSLPRAYVTTRNVANPIGGPATQMSAITLSGQNNRITNNLIYDCGWCILDNYGNNDTGLEIDHNKIWNYNHGLMFAASSAVAAVSPALRFHDNQVLDNLNWETVGCVYHLDGIHTFGTTGNTMDGIYVYNNYFGGQLSACSTGFIFVEGGTFTPSHVLNSAWWNNIFDATGSDTVVLNGQTTGVSDGWVGIFSAQTSIKYVNNTHLFRNSNDGTQLINIGSVNNLTFQGNVENGSIVGNNLGSLTSTPASQVDRNAYGNACNGSNNCFIFNRAFTGSFANWKSASGFDTNGISPTFTGILLGTYGTPLASSPVLALGPNLTASCSGALVTLCTGSTIGGSTTGVARPGSGNWDAGAIQSGSSPTAPSIPAGLSATASGSTANLSWSASTGTAPIFYIVSRSLVSGGPYTQVATGITTTSYADTNLAANTYFYVVSASGPGGTSANSTQVSVTIQPAISIPATPTGVSATVSGTQITIRWTASTGTPTGYNILRSTTSGGPYSALATVGVTTSYVDTGLSPGTYYYVVNAFNSAGTSSNSSQVSGTVVAATPIANLNPSSLSFGDYPVGTTSAPRSTTLQNTGNATLTLAGSNCITVTGPALADYDITTSLVCGGTLAPGAAAQISLTCTPSTTGARSASLSISSNAAPATATLTCNGTAPVSVSPASINFGNQNPGSSTGPSTVTFSNNGSTSVTISSIALTTGTQYAIVNNCGGSLAAFSSCTVDVTFTPTSNGTKTDTLTFTDSASTSPQTVSLSGKGTGRKVCKCGTAQ